MVAPFQLMLFFILSIKLIVFHLLMLRMNVHSATQLSLTVDTIYVIETKLFEMVVTTFGKTVLSLNIHELTDVLDVFFLFFVFVVTCENEIFS